MSNNNYTKIIYPQPKKSTWKKGILNIKQKVVLSLGAGSNCADFFKKTWQNFTYQKIPVAVDVNTAQAENSFILNVETGAKLPALKGKSTYALAVDSKGASALAVDEVSLRQAWLSMLQMLDAQPGTREIEGFQLPCVEIQDYPLLKFRCAHLCVFPETSLAALEKNINLLGMHKYTHVVIEFWGMLKLETLKELSWPQAYSKDEVKPLLKQIRDLGMEPIPMFNHWGHASNARGCYGRHTVLDQNPLLAPLFEPDGWTWCLTNQNSLKILSDIRKELIELFGNTEYFHLGCDEAYSHATCRSCSKHDSAKLFGEHLNSINDDLKSKGIRPFIWGDALLDSTNWDGYIAFSRPDQQTHKVLDILSKDFIIADWQYGVKDIKRDATVKYFIDKGFDVVTAPWYDLQNIEALGEIAIMQNAFGMMLTTWHTLPEKMESLSRGGSVMWGGMNAGKDNPLYRSNYEITSQAAFLRKIRKLPADFVNSGWHSCEVSDI